MLFVSKLTKSCWNPLVFEVFRHFCFRKIELFFFDTKFRVCAASSSTQRVPLMRRPLQSHTREQVELKRSEWRTEEEKHIFKKLSFKPISNLKSVSFVAIFSASLSAKRFITRKIKVCQKNSIFEALTLTTSRPYWQLSTRL